MLSAFIDMKINKFLKKVAEEDRESIINDKDVEFLSSIGVDYNKKKVATQSEPPASYYLTASAFNRRTLAVFFSCFAVAIIAVALILYFSLRPKPSQPPIHYFEDNFVQADSDLQELNNDLKLFSIELYEEYDLEIKKIYDSLSEDNLFYTLSFNQKNGLKKIFKFDVVVNKFYEHEQTPFEEAPIVMQISEYTLKYAENYETISDPFISVTAKGEMQIGEQWIYIMKFEETALGHSTFLDTLQSIIRFN